MVESSLIFLWLHLIDQRNTRDMKKPQALIRKGAEADIAAPRLSDVAYERILESLFERKVPVGAFISQSELSQIVSVPVAPLRDALRMLEAEGILTIHPRSGIQFV